MGNSIKKISDKGQHSSSEKKRNVKYSNARSRLKTVIIMASKFKCEKSDLKRSWSYTYLESRYAIYQISLNSAVFNKVNSSLRKIACIRLYKTVFLNISYN